VEVMMLIKDLKNRSLSFGEGVEGEARWIELWKYKSATQPKLNWNTNA